MGKLQSSLPRSRSGRGFLLAVLGVVFTAVACVPPGTPPAGKTVTVAASLSGTSTLTPGSGLTLFDEVSTGTFSDPVLGDGTYSIVGATAEAEFGFGWSGTVTLSFAGGSTLTGTASNPNVAPPNVDAPLTVDGGTRRFKFATGTLAFSLARTIEDIDARPILTQDSGSITGTLSLRKPPK